MLDGLARRLLDPALDRTGRALAARGVHADALTFAGLACGLGAASPSPSRPTASLSRPLPSIASSTVSTAP